MNATLKPEAKENRFKKILDDAGRSLGSTEDNRFLESLPRPNETKDVQIPFPYGKQPQSKNGWK
ncbi:MAG: hypothetical protein F4X92_07185 [Gammaproteobacteria bacterium]|nr:hypothetical protein [Gammaproteobacteria bacterium]